MANKPFKKLRFSLTGDTYSPVDEQARQNIGDLSQLETTNKSNLVEAINEARESGSGSGVPSGGSKGQVLTKRSSVEGDAGWEYPPVMYATGNDPSNLTVSWNENYTVMDFFMRQSIVQAEYEDSYVVHLKLIKAYITAVAPDFTSVYHFFFGAVSEIVNGTATFGTLEVISDSATAHSGVGVYTEVELGVSEEAIQDAVDDYLELHPTISGTFTNAAKRALLDLLEQVAYIVDNGEDYWNALEEELFAVAVTSITAVFTQGSAVIYETDSLDTLKQYLVVTATYSDSSTETINSYSLSGALTAGESTITVTYENHSDTFTVNVTAWDLNWSAESGSLPSGMTYTSVSWASDNEYADVMNPVYDIGNGDVEVELILAIKTNPKPGYNTNTQLFITRTTRTSCKLYLPNNNTKFVFAGHTNGSSNSITLNDITISQFHKFRFHSSNGQVTLWIDDALIGTRDAYNSQYNYNQLFYSVNTSGANYTNKWALKAIRWRMLT